MYPLVSVIIPTYKNRGLLAKSVSSVLHQDYPNIEIIVVDDNDPSSPCRIETERIMQQFEDSVYYLKHSRNYNGAVARNTGIKKSKGDYIAFLDDDDEFYKNKISKQVEFLENHKEFDASFCFACINGNPIKYRDVFEGDNSIPLLKCRTKMYTPTLMFRRESLLAINGFDESFRRHQDYELLLRFFRSGYKIGCIRDYLVNINTIGGTSPGAVEFEKIKTTFLATFQDVIEELSLSNKKLSREIYTCQYFQVFMSYLSSRHIVHAFRILRCCLKLSISEFIRCLFIFMRNKFNF